MHRVVIEMRSVDIASAYVDIASICVFRKRGCYLYSLETICLERFIFMRTIQIVLSYYIKCYLADSFCRVQFYS